MTKAERGEAKAGLGRPSTPRKNPTRCRIAMIAGALGCLACLFFGYINIQRGFMLGVAVDGALVVWSAIGIYASWRHDAHWVTASAATLGTALLLLVVGGSGGVQVFFWPFAMPFMVFFVAGIRVGLVLNGLLFAVLVVVLPVGTANVVASHLHLTVVPAFAMVVVFAYLYERGRQRSERALRLLSETDGLTGAANRRRFDEALRIEVERAKRYGRCLSVVLLDIDHFKDVNDTFGHPEGDRALKRLTQAIGAQLRETDLLARLGGDEFAIILPETDGPKQGRARAEGCSLDAACARIGRAADALRYPDGRSVKISIGGTTLAEWDSSETILRRADNALYEAKRAGRSRHVVHEAPMVVESTPVPGYAG